MPTIRDVARLAGVSTATVSATINKSAKVSDALQLRVLDAVRQLGYAPDGVARSLKKGRTQLVGLVIADVTNPFFAELVHVIGQAAQAAGYAVLLCNTDQEPEKEQLYLQLMRTHRADGVILTPTGEGPGYAAGLGGLGLPLVLLDRSVAGVAADSVTLDNRAAGRLATRHLLELGHRRIAAITGPAHLSVAAERLAGFAEALAEQGLAPDPALVRHADFREQGGLEACLSVMAEPARPTALFVANNHMLIGVMRGLTQLGLACPADVSVAAIDDFPWANAFTPRLTTVRQPVREMGETALRLLLERLGGAAPSAPRPIVLAPSLVVRESCIAVPQPSPQRRRRA
jgi:LacI family transcriptional regulator